MLQMNTPTLVWLFLELKKHCTMEEKLPPGSYHGSWVWCYEPTDPALRRLRQEDFLDYKEASLDYTVRPRLKKQNKIIGGGRRN